MYYNILYIYILKYYFLLKQDRGSIRSVERPPQADANSEEHSHPPANTIYIWRVKETRATANQAKIVRGKPERQEWNESAGKSKRENKGE